MYNNILFLGGDIKNDPTAYRFYSKNLINEIIRRLNPKVRVSIYSVSGNHYTPITQHVLDVAKQYGHLISDIWELPEAGRYDLVVEFLPLGLSAYAGKLKRIPRIRFNCYDEEWLDDRYVPDNYMTRLKSAHKDVHYYLR